MSMVEDISGFIDSSTNKPVRLLNLESGRRHSVAVFNYGAFFMWGDNEYG